MHGQQNIKKKVVWDVLLYRLVNSYGCFRRNR